MAVMGSSPARIRQTDITPSVGHVIEIEPWSKAKLYQLTVRGPAFRCAGIHATADIVIWGHVMTSPTINN